MSPMQNTSLSFVRRSMLRDSERMRALYFASCRIVNWWLTFGRGEGSIIAGLNIGSQTPGDKFFFNVRQEIRFSLAGAGWRLTNRVLKWVQVVCLTMSGLAIPKLMKWLAAAQHGMRWLQVMSAPTGQHGIRLQIWPTFCLVHLLVW